MRRIAFVFRLLTAWCLLLVSCAPLRAAIPAGTVWEIRPTAGADTNGGGFVSGASGTDFSQQNSAQTTYTDLVIGSTTTQLTSAAHPFGSTHPGNFINITGGSGCTTGWFSISSVSSVTATMDRSVGTAASTCTGNLGGAFATIGAMNSIATAGNITWVKASGTISITSSIAINYSSSASSNVSTQISGYTSTRGDGGPVTIQQSSGSSTMVNITSIGGLTFRNFVIDCNSTNSIGMNIQGTSGQNKAENILVKGGCTNNGIVFNNQGHACVRCTVENLGSGATTGFLMEQGNGPNFCIDCLAVGGTGAFGFKGAVFFCIRCIAANNTGGNTDGFNITTNSGWMFMCQSCIAYKNGRDGFRIAPSSPTVIENSVSYGNTGVGFNDTTGSVPLGGAMFNWNAYGSNTGGNLTNLVAGANDQTLTADPFTNGTSNDFSPNSTAGGGPLLKSNGFPGVLANGGTSIGGTGFLDIGALQSQPPTGGGQTGHATINF